MGSMNLKLPGVGIATEPEYATDVNQAITEIEEHNHTTGSGVRVPSAGINVNGDIPFNGSAIVGASKASLTDTTRTLTGGGQMNKLTIAGCWCNMIINSTTINDVSIMDSGNAQYNVISVANPFIGDYRFTVQTGVFSVVDRMCPQASLKNTGAPPAAQFITVQALVANLIQIFCVDAAGSSVQLQGTSKIHMVCFGGF